MLGERIQPVRVRIEAVRSFVRELEPSAVHVEVVPVYEAYESFVREPRLNCMVTTRETIDVADVANGLRHVSQAGGWMEILAGCNGI